MIETLKPGIVLTTDSGGTATVEKPLGSGAQGEVYQVNWKDQTFALKWYYQQTATPEQLRNLRSLVANGSPDPRFLWPLETVSSAAEIPGFGYLMRLRPSGYKGIIDLMARRSEPTFRVLTTSAFQLTECYLKLHAGGLCYCDISFGNVFWKDDTGEVLICDNDNVIVNGNARSGRHDRLHGTRSDDFLGHPEQRDRHALARGVAILHAYAPPPTEGMKEEAIRALTSLLG